MIELSDFNLSIKIDAEANADIFNEVLAAKLKQLNSDMEITEQKPLGLIGNVLHSRMIIDEFVKDSDSNFVLEDGCNIDEIKQFRIWLQKNSLSRKVAIIERLDKFSEQKQAVLLKIFETLPSNTIVFFTAAYLPTFTIQTRSEIYFIANDSQNQDTLQMMNAIIQSMKKGEFDENMHQAWNIYLQAQSLFFDGIVNENERNVILKSIGIDLAVRELKSENENG